ncbi:MAG: cardiolipin synthase [Cyclobacteriaceae bacterium]|nr:cardiolipin synthase [Cyclobacteriaceae bacterium]
MGVELDFRDILTIGYYLLAIATVVFVIQDNRSPHKTLSWILVLITLPIIGLILYFYFGHNFRKEKLFEGKRKLDIKRISRIVQEQSLDLSQHVDKLGKAAKKIKVINLVLRNNKSRLTKNNRLTVLNDGIETYTSLLRALGTAKKHIHLEYYIFEEGEVANKIKNILIKKVEEGVEVRLLYDSVGSWNLSEVFLDELKIAGIKTAESLPVQFPLFTSKINYRNHRKIVIIDGVTGYLGGINISDKYLNIDQDIGMPWRDTHLKIEGDSVKDLQLVFLTDWYFATRDFIEDEDKYFPETNIEDSTIVQILASGPDTDHKAVMNAYFTAITSAEKSICITTPYFMPNETILNALKIASASGINVKMIIPGISDSTVVKLCSQSYFEDLMESGIEIYQFHGGFIHSKTLLVDNLLASIGTANMDFRSFEQNMEVNAFIYDKKVCKNLELQFQNDLMKSRKLGIRSWKKRKRIIKISESFSRLFAPLL